MSLMHFYHFYTKEKLISPSVNASNSLKSIKNYSDALSKKYYEIAKLFKMKSLPPDELRPPVEEKVEEEEVDPKKKKEKKKIRIKKQNK